MLSETSPEGLKRLEDIAKKTKENQAISTQDEALLNTIKSKINKEVPPEPTKTELLKPVEPTPPTPKAPK